MSQKGRQMSVLEWSLKVDMAPVYTMIQKLDIGSILYQT